MPELAQSSQMRQNSEANPRADDAMPQTHINNPFDTPFDEDNEDEGSADEEYEIAAGAHEHKPNTSRMTQWPTIPNSVTPAPVPHKPQTRTRKSVKRYSVQKPTREKSRQRQKRQNERAGIKVITNFSRHHGPAPVVKQSPANTVPVRPAPEVGRFVDLAALQALESRAPNNGGFWKSLLGTAPDAAIPPARTADLHEHGQSQEEATTGLTRGFGSRRAKDLKPPSLNLQDDLSPGDRPIVIGISIPSAKLGQHVPSPQTAVSETSNIIQSYETHTPKDAVPETPVIMITPAEVSHWSPFSSKTTTPQSRRVPSSVYSRPVSFSFDTANSSNIPPMPQLPPSVLQSQRHGRDSVGTIFSEDEETPTEWRKKSRILSSGTIFEEDESPILTRKKRAGSDASMGKHKSTLLLNENRTSVGWWNTVVSPFLSRSNTLLSPQTTTQEERPPLPNITTNGAKAHDNIGDISIWEKSFSPKSPLSSTTIASDAWWESRNTIDGGPKWTETDFKADFKAKDEIHRHKPQASESATLESGTLPFMLAIGDDGRAVSSTNQEVQPSGNDNTPNTCLHRDQSMTVPSNRFSTVSPSDREAPLILDTSMLPAPFTTGDRHSIQISPAQPTTNRRSAMIPSQAQHQESTEDSTHLDNPLPPPPYSPPRPAFRKLRAIYPPGHVSGLQPPQSPGPLSPGLQQAMSSNGAIAMSEVPLTPPPRRVINLNSGYPSLPPRTGTAHLNPVDFERASEKARKIEAKRRRHEKEDAMANKAGGLWRGRGCISNRGCYGRSGSEGRKRRRCWFGMIAGLVALVILIVVLATQLNRSAPSVDTPSQWLNLTAFPPIYTGASTVAAPENTVSNTGCVYPKTVWSCALPKELQSSVAPNKPNQPNLKLFIQWDNSSAANATWGGSTTKTTAVRRSAGNAVTAGQVIKRLLLQAREAIMFTPSPAAPTFAEQAFLGNTTDGIVSDNKAGEQTPFYISFIDPQSEATTLSQLSRRDANITGEFQDFSKSIPPPDLKADGTAAAANLLPLPKQQPLRLFDRGLPTEHYGFYTYFSRSIFLKSTALLNATNAGDGEVPDDLDGGCSESEARFRCTWSETRFLVQMWTRKNGTAALFNSTGSASTGRNATEIANDFERPGSFPYPITITTDRHGGTPSKKGVYCYELDVREKVVAGSAKVRPEFRGFGGVLVNQAPSDFNNRSSNANLGGYDGGTSGCSCQWANWHSVI